MVTAVVHIATSPAVARTPATCRGWTVTIAGTDGSELLVGTPGRDVIAGNDGDGVIKVRP